MRWWCASGAALAALQCWFCAWPEANALPAAAVLRRGLRRQRRLLWRCCCGQAAPWLGVSPLAAVAMLLWTSCAMARGVAPGFFGGAAVAVLQSWFCAVACGDNAACSGGSEPWPAALQCRSAGAAPWRCWLLSGTSRSERLHVSEFCSMSYCFRG